MKLAQSCLHALFATPALLLALNPFNILHFLDKDLMVKIIYFLIVTYRALNYNSKPKIAFSLPHF